MGMIQKKDDQKEVIDGIEVIGRGEGPDGIEKSEVELHEGMTAEDISGTTAEREGTLELEADPELVGDIESKDEPGEDADKKSKHKEDSAAKKPVRKRRRMPRNHGKIVIAVAVVAVVAAGILGYFIGAGGFGSKGADSATLTDEQLDTTVASWKSKGGSHRVSAKEVLESQYSLDAIKSPEGTYPTPPADAVLSYIRNQIMLDDAKANGIEVDDDAIKAYAKQNLGTSDFDSIAQQYRVSEDQAKEIVRQQALIRKLYEKVVPGAVDTPQQPSEPADGNAQAATKEYADYIIKLAGKEWDAKKGTWAATDGPVATALAGAEFNPESATYEQAQAAFYGAYQAYAQEAAKQNEAWTTYVNGLFGKADVSLYGLFA